MKKMSRTGNAIMLAIMLTGTALAAEMTKTPAEIKIGQAQTAIEKEPKLARHYSDLALALTRRARETADPKFYQQAEAALQKSMEIEPNNFAARRIHAWTMLGKHEFAAALAEATALNKEMPDDIMIYGYLADANIELGNYEDAEKATQWMLDLRPGNVPGLTRAAYLRELFGDIEGSLDFMISAYERTPWNEREDRAWILTHIAHLELSRGKLDAAEKVLDAAFDLYPGYHYALGQMGKLRAAQGRHEEAVAALQQLVSTAPNPENYFPLGEAQMRAGQTAQAAATFAEFEKKALVEVAWMDNANRELIFYYADHAENPAKAMHIAREEFARRQDIFTLDAYAWALHKNGESAEARAPIEKALVVGVRDAKLFYHAGMIYHTLGERELALKYLNHSLTANPVSEFAEPSRAVLESLGWSAAELHRD